MIKKKKRKNRTEKTIIAIDPGPLHSGVIRLEGDSVTFVDAGMENRYLREWAQRYTPDVLAVEGIECHGMAVGKPVFETCYMVGRLQQIAEDMDQPFMLVYRSQEKMHLCHSMQAKPKNIRQALLDMFPATGGGKTPQVGIQSNKGPLFGVGTHAWSALAIAVYARDHI